MLRSMYAGISGMRNFQTKLDVIGNNIANVGTAGFKKGRVTFQDMLSQTSSGAQAPTETRGGINPAQIGLGSQLGSIDNIHTQGFRQTTNNPLDFALEGDGMFIVQGNNVTAYTRAGNFLLDSNGRIVNQDGYYLMGFPVDEMPGINVQTDDFSITLSLTGEVIGLAYQNELIDLSSDEVIIDNNTIQIGDDLVISYTFNGQGEEGEMVSNLTVNGSEIPSFREDSTTIPNVDYTGTLSSIRIPDNAKSFSVEANGTVNYIDENGQPRIAGQIAIANFSNPAGLEKAGSNLFFESSNSGNPVIMIPESEGAASVISGALEMSNVDLAEEFTEMITAQRGFQANTRIITTSDEILQELVNLKR